jgi:NarL family two-component system response regulator LiaR
MSNAQIAEHLTLSEKTVKSHVTNILSKLYLSDRTQAAVLAWQKGIVRRTDR